MTTDQLNKIVEAARPESSEYHLGRYCRMREACGDGDVVDCVERIAEAIHSLATELATVKAELAHCMECNCDLCGNKFPDHDAYCSGCWAEVSLQLKQVSTELDELRGKL